MNSDSFRRSVAPFLLCLLVFVASGCSRPVPVPPPPEKERALSWNQRGLNAAARGNIDVAISAFEESLRVNRSIEYFDGMAVSLLNLARLHRRKGELATATARIDEALRLISPGDPVFREAAFEKALLEISLENLPEATKWAQKAVPSERRPYSGRMQNLLARILFLDGKTAEALSLAKTALESNRQAANRVEEANSLRLIGDITLAGGDPQGAKTLYLETLSIDKELAQSAKIAQDLQSLGDAATALGEIEQAKDYYERAAQVRQHGRSP